VIDGGASRDDAGDRAQELAVAAAEVNDAVARAEPCPDEAELPARGDVGRLAISSR
jgi:hypothetical protein